jgi:DNA polymerase III delta prime subunit
MTSSMKNRLNNLLLHPQSKLQLKNTLNNPPQALLISAIAGSGKKTLSAALAAELLKLPPAGNINDYPYYFHVRRLKNKNDISIAQIRETVDALKLKVPGSKIIKRLIFIEDAQFLSIPAQNALLKNLEEPNPDTVFLLSVNSVQNVLPTISSRTQRLELQPVSLIDAKAYWDDKFAASSIESAWRLSGGSIGLMHALLNKNEDHPLKKAVDDAKELIRASKYQRLLQADRTSRNKDQFVLLLDALSRTLSFLQQTAVKNNKEAQSKNILISRKAIKESSEALDTNANPRLVALKLVMSLKI